MKLIIRNKGIPTLLLLLIPSLILSLASCGGSTQPENNVKSDNGEKEIRQTITGRILDSASGAGIQNASIWTDPPTSTTTSNANGNYNIEDGLDRSTNQYKVYAMAPGYAANNGIISVSGGGFSTADIQLHIQKTGLSTNPSTLRFTNKETSKTFYLTSTINNSNFSIESTTAWLSGTPINGTIANANGEKKTITVSVNRDGLAKGNYTGELSINSSNVSGTTLSVIMAVGTTLAPLPSASISLQKDEISVQAGASVTINPLDNDTGSSLQITDNTEPTKGSVTRSGNTFKYSANTGASGTDSFSYTVGDSNGDSASASVLINILEKKVPEKPFASNIIESHGFRIKPGICEISVAIMTCHFTITNIEDSGKFTVFSGNSNSDLTRIIDSGNEYRGSKVYFGPASGYSYATNSLLTNIGVDAKITFNNIPTDAEAFQTFEIQFLDGWTSGERFSVRFSDIHIINRNN